LTQWAYCIYDDEKNLELIEKVFRSSKFNKIKNSIQMDSSSYNIKVMKLFKKTFIKILIMIMIQLLIITTTLRILKIGK